MHFSFFTQLCEDCSRIASEVIESSLVDRCAQNHSIKNVICDLGSFQTHVQELLEIFGCHLLNAQLVVDLIPENNLVLRLHYELAVFDFEVLVLFLAEEVYFCLVIKLDKKLIVSSFRQVVLLYLIQHFQVLIAIVHYRDWNFEHVTSQHILRHLEFGVDW